MAAPVPGKDTTGNLRNYTTLRDAYQDQPTNGQVLSIS